MRDRVPAPLQPECEGRTQRKRAGRWASFAIHFSKGLGYLLSLSSFLSVKWGVGFDSKIPSTLGFFRRKNALMLLVKAVLGPGTFSY